MLEYTLTESDLAAFAAWRDETSGELARRQRKQRVLGAWPAWFTNAAARDARPVEQVSYAEIGRAHV